MNSSAVNVPKLIVKSMTTSGAGRVWKAQAVTIPNDGPAPRMAFYSLVRRCSMTLVALMFDSQRIGPGLPWVKQLRLFHWLVQPGLIRSNRAVSSFQLCTYFSALDCIKKQARNPAEESESTEASMSASPNVLT